AGHQNSLVVGRKLRSGGARALQTRAISQGLEGVGARGEQKGGLRQEHQRLANGKTLVLLPEAAFLFTSGTDTFESLTNSASLQRAGATATELPTDHKRILVTGGISSSHELFQEATLFNPARIQTDRDDYPP